LLKSIAAIYLSLLQETSTQRFIMANMQEKEDRRPPQRIAIIGGGISGIACSWGLRAHDCDVDIYEADVKLGGHANSVPFHGPDVTVSVDTGFAVLDEKRYLKRSKYT
jgi:predicted NAD/FAD-binding protein